MSPTESAEFDGLMLRLEQKPVQERREIIRTLLLGTLQRDPVKWLESLITGRQYRPVHTLELRRDTRGWRGLFTGRKCPVRLAERSAVL